MSLDLSLTKIAIKSGGKLHENLETPLLMELALQRGEGRLTALIPLANQAKNRLAM